MRAACVALDALPPSPAAFSEKAFSEKGFSEKVSSAARELLEATREAVAVFYNFSHAEKCFYNGAAAARARTRPAPGRGLVPPNFRALGAHRRRKRGATGRGSWMCLGFWVGVRGCVWGFRGSWMCFGQGFVDVFGVLG